MLTVSNLKKNFGSFQAVKGVSFSVGKGEVLGFLGPNGAGKSSLIKAALGFIQPASGRIRVLGIDAAADPMAVRTRVGYMPENDAHMPGMNAVSFVAYCAELSGLPRSNAMQRAHEVLFYVGLGEARYRTVDTYSTGMKQRIKLAQALVHDPDLLLLDEPTNGMDPAGRDEMLRLVRDLAVTHGVNVIVSSHVLPDIEATCSSVIVVNGGRVAAQGPLASLTGAKGQAYELRVKTAPGSEPFADTLRRAGIECDATGDDVMRVFVPGDGAARRLFELAAGAHVQVRHLRPGVQTLEDVFASAVGGE